jgi:hypothetical protein
MQPRASKRLTCSVNLLRAIAAKEASQGIKRQNASCYTSHDLPFKTSLLPTVLGQHMQLLVPGLLVLQIARTPWSTAATAEGQPLNANLGTKWHAAACAGVLPATMTAARLAACSQESLKETIWHLVCRYHTPTMRTNCTCIQLRSQLV